MDIKKVEQPKRRSERANDTTQSSRKGSKRRRIHEPTKVGQDEPEPMDIDPPLKPKAKSSEIVGAPVKSNGLTKQQATVTAPPPFVAQQATPSASTTANTSNNGSLPTSRYVPKAPPTVQQIVDRLRGASMIAAAKTGKKKSVVKTMPKPPPPTPSILSPLPSRNVSTDAPRQHQSAPTRHSRSRIFLYRTVVIVWFAVMLRLALGFVETPSLNDVLKNIQSSPRFPVSRIYPHIKPPSHLDGTEHRRQVLANMTLRDFLENDEGFHLALAPAFFGIYGYTGMLMTWDESTNYFDNIKSVVGASAGAMAAVILAAGIQPHKVAALGKSMTLQKFADPPGLGGVFQGNKFESIMHEFITSESPNSTMLMQDSIIPVAVTAFDLKSFQGRILTRGSMAKAARASATFPLLFQPVVHEEGLLIDGGVTDMLGLRGLAAFDSDSRPKRVVNVAVGGFLTAPPGPQSMPDGVNAEEVLSISILNTPQCGPWALANGPRAIEGARRAMLASLDLPLYHGKERGHYELHVDALSFVE